MASISNTSIMDQKPKSASDYHRQIRPPEVGRWERGEKDTGSSKGQRQKPTSGFCPQRKHQAAPLLTDPPQPLLLNSPSTHFGEFTGGDSTPRGTMLSRQPCASDREKKGNGGGGGTELPLPPRERQAPTRRTQLQENEKMLYCLKSKEGLLDMGNLKLNTSPVIAVCS